MQLLDISLKAAGMELPEGLTEFDVEPSYSPSRAEVMADSRLQDLEMELCGRDPLRFILRWCFTLDEVDEANPIKRFPWKPHIAYYVRVWILHKLILVPKSRRMMMSWVNLALLVWDAIFKPYRKNFVQSKREPDAIDLVEKALFIVDRLPPFLKQDYTYKMKPCIVRFENGSELRGIPHGGDIIRMHTASNIMVDEGEKIPDLKETIIASKPCTEGGGRLVIISTVGTGYFSDLIEDYEGGK
jgi:hypothetical protein